MQQLELTELKPAVLLLRIMQALAAALLRSRACLLLPWFRARHLPLLETLLHLTAHHPRQVSSLATV